MQLQPVRLHAGDNCIQTVIIHIDRHGDRLETTRPGTIRQGGGGLDRHMAGTLLEKDEPGHLGVEIGRAIHRFGRAQAANLDLYRHGR
jgi:hypothetical protein